MPKTPASETIRRLRASAARAAPSLLVNSAAIGGVVSTSVGFEELRKGLGLIVFGLMLLAGAFLGQLGRGEAAKAADKEPAGE